MYIHRLGYWILYPVDVSVEQIDGSVQVCNISCTIEDTAVLH